MDGATSTVTRRFPSPGPGDKWKFAHLSTSASSLNSPNDVSVLRGESWATQTSGETVPELDYGKRDKDFDPRTSGSPRLAANRDRAVTGPVDNSRKNGPRALDEYRLRTLLSGHGRVIAGHDQSDRGNAPSGYHNIAVVRHFSDTPISTSDEGQNATGGRPRSRSQTLEPATGSARQRISPLCGRTRRSQRQRNKMPSALPYATKTAQRGVQKKRVSAGQGLEYEFLRLSTARRTPSGSIEYKVIWQPSWVNLEDLRGKRALEEAEELVLGKFGRPTWDMELLEAGYMDDMSDSE
ncbi:hypothetical protein Purlil1_12262 [Purpureocillium lilacinum]|uniref:Chromo domain-containing protein n=1 Tax=Purpureocillium lilacinum TaxID=33203 RepID=A0ABR0BHJ1_PURLI|nr:hypothetical protein Purlil1_12262 [Purpureocillium lilacinum]